jgi:hypothetical protein
MNRNFGNRIPDDIHEICTSLLVQSLGGKNAAFAQDDDVMGWG